MNAAQNADSYLQTGQLVSIAALLQASAQDLAEERERRELAEAREKGLLQMMMYKDGLVQEAHHRAKNTIQIAASMLSLQARETPSAEVRSVLLESRARLHVLAHVHELLYRSADGNQEILMPTLLQTIGDALRRSFAELSDRVTLTISSDPVALAPDDAIPLSLFANETLTNAYKHAFPLASSGRIDLTLRRAHEAVILQISDNGIGMPASGGPSGLGLTLIRRFATQLKATLAFSKPLNTTGTLTTLTIDREWKPAHVPEPNQGSHVLDPAAVIQFERR